MGRLTLEQVATAAAKRYAARCSWVDYNDCRSVARIACIEASHTWKVGHGTPLDAYAWRACILALRRHVWKMSAPVSAPDKRLTDLDGIVKVPVDEVTNTPKDQLPIDEEIDTRRWVARVRDRLRVIVKDDLGLEALLTGERPAEVARRRAVPVSRVYVAKRRARNIVRDDEQTHQLWRQLWK